MEADEPPREKQDAEAIRSMPPNQECPHRRRLIEDWHIEWYKSEATAINRGLAAMDCPLCGGAVLCRMLLIGLAPSGVPVLKREVTQAAEWAESQSTSGTLQGYISSIGPGTQYANYWTFPEVHQANAIEHAKKRGP